ncbi:unnamed protein product [Malus baccata var. baccata]
MTSLSSIPKTYKPGSEMEFCGPLRPLHSKGIWVGDNPLQNPFSLMLAQTLLIVITSRVLYFFLRPLGQTKVVCSLLAGIIMGPSVLGRNKELRDKLFPNQDYPLFSTISWLGVIYSIFLMAVKLDISMVRRTVNSTWKIGLAGFIFPLAVTLTILSPLACNVRGLSGGKILVLFSSLSLSYTYIPNIAQAMDDLNLMTSELGQLAMSSAMLSDIIQWAFTTLHYMFMQKHGIQGLEAFISLLALLYFSLHVIRPALLLIIKKTPKDLEVKESYIVAIQLGVLVMAFISDFIGTAPTTGPLILGLSIPHGPPLGATLVQKTEFMVSKFLLPTFFFRVGYTIDVYSIHDWSSFTKLQIIIVVSYVAKIGAITVAALCCKIRLKNSLLLGVILNIKGIIDLIAYNRWKTMEMVDDQCFTQILLSFLVVTMILTPIVRFSYKPQIRSLTSTKLCSAVRNMQSMPKSNETFRILCCFHNQESVRTIITLLEASNPTDTSPICAYVVHAVEHIGPAGPMLIPYKKQRKTFKRTDSPTRQMMRAFENYSRNSRGPVTIQTYKMIVPYKCMHETIFHLTNDKLIPLIIVPFHQNHQSMVGSTMTAAIRQFNINVQAYAPCTVGILVDRGFSAKHGWISHFTYNVGLFFIGGPDDREALSYAFCMSGSPDVGLTVYRFTFRNKLEEEDEEEKKEEMLDESLVDEFKLRNVGNDCLNWIDIEVDDNVQVMDTIRQSQVEYDLVMVGRRHTNKALSEEQMAEFMENAELGVIGDMLASPDFCGGMVNVLVMQETRGLSHKGFRNESAKSSLRTSLKSLCSFIFCSCIFI